MRAIRRRARALYTYRAHGVRSWRAHLGAARRIERTLGRRPHMSADADVVLTLNSFQRPQNIELIAWLALCAPSVRRVVVSNNDPSVDLGAHVSIDDPRLEIRDAPARRGPLTRYLLARDVGARRFVSVDDDLFLHPSQLEALIGHLRERPEVPHGFYGQLYAGGRFRYNRGRGEGRVDVLNRAYAFTDVHLARYFERLDSLGLSDAERDAFTMDDVPLGFVSDERPAVHELGPYVDCATEAARGLAIFRAPGEHPRRAALFERLCEVAGRPARGGPDAPAIRAAASPRWLPAAGLYYGSGVGLAVDALGRARDALSRG